VELVFAQIRDVGNESLLIVVVHDASGHDPAHVGPEAAIAGRMRIAFHISILVMDAVRGHPEKRAAFQRQRSAESDEILEPFIGFETAMGQQTVIRYADPKAPGNPPQEDRDKKGLPGKHEKRRDRAYVKCEHEKCCELADWFPKCPIPLEKVHE
jgi:hypothetical protein